MKQYKSQVSSPPLLQHTGPCPSEPPLKEPKNLHQEPSHYGELAHSLTLNTLLCRTALGPRSLFPSLRHHRFFPSPLFLLSFWSSLLRLDLLPSSFSSWFSPPLFFFISPLLFFFTSLPLHLLFFILDFLSPLLSSFFIYPLLLLSHSPPPSSLLHPGFPLSSPLLLLYQTPPFFHPRFLLSSSSLPHSPSTSFSSSSWIFPSLSSPPFFITPPFLQISLLLFFFTSLPLHLLLFFILDFPSPLLSSFFIKLLPFFTLDFSSPLLLYLTPPPPSSLLHPGFPLSSPLLLYQTHPFLHPRFLLFSLFISLPLHLLLFFILDFPSPLLFSFIKLLLFFILDFSSSPSLSHSPSTFFSSSSWISPLLSSPPSLSNSSLSSP
ncbi:hypothetical protein C7M84_000422 [Penaeus vannamei]|uniref:Uncharacterized protein n=1 Tax=Penaeus vannamei TaxID=6689 RepID=A0A3R7MMI3_PENVA|nr:hypothetical protein C7M84_000422 [Penaeus vannamei]